MSRVVWVWHCLGALAAASALILIKGPSAHAYRTGSDLPVLSDVADGSPIRWGAPLALNVHASGIPGFSVEDSRRSVEEALATWSEPACSDVAFFDVSVEQQPAAADDERNTLQALTRGWEERGFDPALPAVTDVAYLVDEAADPPRVEIIEADVYLNAQHFDFAAGDEQALDIAAVLTHEMGHVLGLAHPCSTPEAPEPGTPACSSDAAFTGLTMHPAYNPMQVALADDDIAGICFLYPSERGPMSPGDPPHERENRDADDQHPRGEPLGAACDDRRSCAGGECLIDDSASSVCTRECDREEAMCPSGWMCRQVDGKDVCAPRSHGGCSVHGEGNLGSAWIALLAAAWVALRRRGRKGSPCPPEAGGS